MRAKLGTRPGQQNLSQQEILIKALQSDLSFTQASQAAQFGRRPTAPKPTEKQKYRGQVQYWTERGYTPKEAIENVKLAAEISAGFKSRASSANKLKDKPLPEQLKFWQNLQSSSQGQYYGFAGFEEMKNPKVAELAGENAARILEEMKGSSRGTPTADELKKLGTRAAYEQGKKLGYWQ